MSCLVVTSGGITENLVFEVPPILIDAWRDDMQAFPHGEPTIYRNEDGDTIGMGFILDELDRYIRLVRQCMSSRESAEVVAEAVAKLFGGIWPDESAALPHGVQAIYDTYPLTSNQEAQAADRTLENASEYIKRVVCPDAD